MATRKRRKSTKRRSRIKHSSIKQEIKAAAKRLEVIAKKTTTTKRKYTRRKKDTDNSDFYRYN